MVEQIHSDPRDLVHVAAVGDITLGDHPMTVGFGYDSVYRRNTGLSPFCNVLDDLSRADLVFGNLECTLSRAGENPNRYSSVQMRGRPDYLEHLRSAGFTVLNHATNHSMQHGREPFIDTVRILHDAGIRTCGVREKFSAKAAPCRVEIRGRTMSFLGYNTRPRQYFVEEPLYVEGQFETMIEDVREAKRQSDHVIVSLHWGEEFFPAPSPEELRLGRDLADAGADLVVGHHPHVLRGLERHGRALVAYSLGNFICDMSWDERLRETFILHCWIGLAGVERFEAVPIFINDMYLPEVVSGDRAYKIRRTLESASSLLSNENLEDYDAKSARYAEDANTYIREYRKKAHAFFLKNIHRYPKSILIQQLGEFVHNRRNELVGILRDRATIA